MRRASGHRAPAPRRSSFPSVPGANAKGLGPLSSCSAKELLPLRTLSVSEGPRAIELLLRGGAPPYEVLHFVQDTGAKGLGPLELWPARSFTSFRTRPRRASCH